MNEITRVATKGSWVRTVVSTRAGRSGVRRGWWSLLVGHPDLGGEFLALVERLGHAELSGDRAGDVLGDLRSQRREFWDVDELDADGGSGLNTGIGGVGPGDGRLGGLGNRSGSLKVL